MSGLVRLIVPIVSSVSTPLTLVVMLSKKGSPTIVVASSADPPVTVQREISLSDSSINER